MVRLHAVLELPLPVDELVRWKQRSIRMSDKRVVRRARGLGLKGDVADLADETLQPGSLLALVQSIPEDAAGKRDRALLSVGYDAGLRRSGS